MTAHRPLSLLLLLCLHLGHPCFGTERIAVFGDSLSKEYQVEFSNFDARNWIELLDEHRHDDFNVGSFEVFPDFRVTGHEYNWSFPGATADDMLDNLTDDGFFQEIAQDEIKDQLRKEVDRVVIFLGGNDMRNGYRRLYENDEPDQYTNRVFNNIQSILNWVRARNANLEIVLANVPHIGATPLIKEDYGTDPAKVANATGAISRLNQRLATLAQEVGVGYADVFRITTDLLEEKPFCISGVRFLDESNNNAGKFYLWLGGIGGDFHPNTNGQTAVANAIIKAFNDTYDAGIVPLGGTEILSEILGIESNRSFEDWIACYEPGALGNPWDDLDRDGYDNFTEFAFDMDPTRLDALPITSTAPYQVTFRPRLRTSEHVAWRFETSTDLANWSPAPPASLTETAFGRYRWQTTETAPALFTRIVVVKP